MNSGFRYGLLGRDFQKTKEGQLGILSKFCTKHGGSIEQTFVIPGIRRSASPLDITMSVCFANDKSPLAALGTRIAADKYSRTDTLFAYYFSKSLVQSIYNFRSNIKAGDKSQFGLITDVRGNIANVQLNGLAKMQFDTSEKWIEIGKLVPAVLSKLPL